MIRATISGAVLRDAEIKNVNGFSVINFTISSSEFKTGINGQAEAKTTWVSCSFWTDNLGLASLLTRDATVIVEGIPGTKLINKTNGSYASSLTLKVLWIHFVGLESESILKLKGGLPVGSSY